MEIEIQDTDAIKALQTDRTFKADRSVITTTTQSHGKSTSTPSKSVQSSPNAALRFKGNQSTQRVKIVIQKRFSQLSNLIEQTRQKRLAIAAKLASENDKANELDNLLKRLTADGDTS